MFGIRSKLFALTFLVIPLSAIAAPIPIKVVVVSMFEYGEITGDRPGEFQFWAERLPLEQSLPFPAGEFDLRLNEDGVLGICTGGGIANATASVMALGMDDRFDLSNAYWLVAGIAGADPEDLSLGSAAWAKFVIDGDLLVQIDAREIPADWPYGIVPLGSDKPAKEQSDLSTGWTVDTIEFALNDSLVNWAYRTTKDVEIPETGGLAKFRAQFRDNPNAMKSPFVTIGDSLSSSTYWHGHHLNDWANDWVKLYSSQQGNFMTSNMEDSGTMTALYRLARINKVDANRVMVLRTASNFTVPPPGKTATWSATAEYPDKGRAALEAAYRVGSVVVKTLVANWAQYQNELPR
ncbi:purine nucleoside permease [Gammaproteobacteria bacterium]|nr:purine nucleoside permease [Gammaproteobacteria bacterium]